MELLKLVLTSILLTFHKPSFGGTVYIKNDFKSLFKSIFLQIDLNTFYKISHDVMTSPTYNQAYVKSKTCKICICSVNFLCATKMEYTQELCQLHLFAIQSDYELEFRKACSNCILVCGVALTSLKSISLRFIHDYCDPMFAFNHSCNVDPIVVVPRYCVVRVFKTSTLKTTCAHCWICQRLSISFHTVFQTTPYLIQWLIK